MGEYSLSRINTLDLILNNAKIKTIINKIIVIYWIGISGKSVFANLPNILVF